MAALAPRPQSPAGGGAKWFEEAAGGVVVNVKAVPRSSKPGIDGLYGDEAVKVRISAAPVDGKANRELTEVLARAFGVPKSAVEILSGAASKHKRVMLRGVGAGEVSKRVMDAQSR